MKVGEVKVALILGYFWAVVCNLFNSISSLEKKNEESNGCCNLNYRIGVQIMAGILTILSAVVLVLHYVKLDEEIKDRYLRLFKEEPSWNLTVSSQKNFNDSEMNFNLLFRLSYQLSFWRPLW